MQYPPFCFSFNIVISVRGVSGLELSSGSETGTGIETGGRIELCDFVISLEATAAKYSWLAIRQLPNSVQQVVYVHYVHVHNVHCI